MSFKVKDLSVSLSIDDGGSTCTTLTKPTGGETGACIGSLFLQDGAAGRRNLSVLRNQLRNAMTRA
jgi:hypothetical protein